MSEPRRWLHAGEVAHWAVLLLGWLWLGEQGMRWGWSLASGVLAVVLWWSARLLCRGSAWALRASPTSMAWCGGLSALGVWLPEALASGVISPVHADTLNAGPLNLAHAGLWLVALLWGAWTGLVETRNRVSTFALGPLAWHPVLAAGLVVLAWRAPAGVWAASWGVSVLLALCAAVLYARDSATAGILPACRGQRAGLGSILPASVMGLMMGGLWLGNAWCIGLGGSTQEMVVWHLAMMAVLPPLVALVDRLCKVYFGVPFEVPFGLNAGGASALELTERQSQFRTCLSLALLALGALMLLGQSALHGLLVMLLPSLAWAVHCSRPRTATGTALGSLGGASPWLLRGMALALGPGLLMWVGVTSPTQGPMAMQTALALLGILATAQALVLWLRSPALQPTWSISSSH